MSKRKNRKAKKFYSTRQKIAVKKLSEIVLSKKNNKNITIRSILKEAGYSDSYSESPSKVFKSKNFQEALNEYLPDDVIAEVHGGVLRAAVLGHYDFSLKESNASIKKVIESVPGCVLQSVESLDGIRRAYYLKPDNQSRMRAISEAYKVKNKYAPEEHIITNKLTDELLERIIKD